MKCIKHYDFTTMSTLDADWSVEVGEKWANRELQHYVNDSEHLVLNQDGLHIRATYKDGIYRSARLNTKGRFAFKEGRIDIVATIPGGRGTWVALWLMSDDQRYGRWPKSGEIDLMEHVGNRPGLVYCCLHTERYNHKQKDYYFATYERPDVIGKPHTYSLIWEEDAMTYLLDGIVMARHEKGGQGRIGDQAGWPFDHPFYLIMNMAIGGTLGGPVSLEDFPQTFTIQSIKVYQ